MLRGIGAYDWTAEVDEKKGLVARFALSDRWTLIAGKARDVKLSALLSSRATVRKQQWQTRVASGP